MSPCKKKEKSCVNAIKFRQEWTLESAKKFIDTLMDVTMCKNIMELKNHILLECFWTEMEIKFNINKRILMKFWNNKLHLQLFCTTPIYLNDIKIKLIEYLYKHKINAAKINWKSIALSFDGCTRYFLTRVYFNLVKDAKRITQSSKRSILLKYLYNKYIPCLINNREDKMLPRLKYTNDTLTFIDFSE